MGRSLSLSGKMKVAKRFGLILIVNAMLPYSMIPNDLKVIEKANYAFVNGRTDSNGPEMKSIQRLYPFLLGTDKLNESGLKQ